MPGTIRVKQNRNIIHKDKALNISKFADNFKCRHQAKITYFKESGKKTKDISYGSATVKIDALKDKELNLVIVKGFGKSPMLIFTNKFYNYALADGIYNYLYSNKYGIEYITKKPAEIYNGQLELMFE